MARHEVWWHGELLALTRKEFGVLEYLLTHQGAVVSAEELLEHVWDENADPFTQTVRVTVGTLRRKLGAGGRPAPLETVIGRGYRFKEPRETTAATGWMRSLRFRLALRWSLALSLIAAVVVVGLNLALARAVGDPPPATTYRAFEKVRTESGYRTVRELELGVVEDIEAVTTARTLDTLRVYSGYALVGCS